MGKRWNRARGVSAWESAPEDLQALALQVLDDALLTLSRGPLTPFVVVETAEGARLHQLEDLPSGRAWLSDLPPAVHRAVVARPGELQRHGETVPTVLVEAYERGMRATATIAQRYEARPAAEPRLIGEVYDAGDAPALLT